MYVHFTSSFENVLLKPFFQRVDILVRLVMAAHDQIRAHLFSLESVPRDQLLVREDPACQGLIILGTGVKRRVLGVRHQVVSNTALSALPFSNSLPLQDATLNLHAHTQRHSGSLRMHPLLAVTRLHNAPISYDILYTPSTRTVLDRTTHMAVPPHTLAQPATDPATPISARIVLRSDKFPWPVVVGPSSSSKSGSRFYLGGSDKSNHSAITNLDLLYALHTTLLTRVTPQEWESLGHGSRAQRKVTQAYEKRCKRMGGGWEGGVRRIDWLHCRTRLVGVEVDKYGQGKLSFSKA